MEHTVQLAAYANAEYAIAGKRPVVQAGKKEAWNGTLIEWGQRRRRGSASFMSARTVRRSIP